MRLRVRHRKGASTPSSDRLREPPSRGRLYYGWVIVGVLALTETVSYGVLMYAFPVVLAPMRAELGWSQAMLTGGFSAAALTQGALAPLVGRWVDRRGGRLAMTTGSAAATLLVLLWSRADHPLIYYAVWVGLGACMAAVFYEPAFTVAAQWFRRNRTRAITAITLAGGLASTLFVPLTSWLTLTLGWRAAIAWLAVLLAVLTLVPHGLLLRRSPADVGQEIDGVRATAGDPWPLLEPERFVEARAAVRSAPFRWLTLAFSMATIGHFALAVHLIPLLLDRGHSLAFAAAAMAGLGLAKLPGRLLVGPLAHRWSATRVTEWIFLGQAACLLMLAIVPATAAVWVAVALFGAGDGASTPARAAAVADTFGPRDYGRILGTQASVLAVARAAGPVGASLVWTALRGYGAVLGLLASVLVVAALATGYARGAAPPMASSAGSSGARSEVHGPEPARHASGLTSARRTASCTWLRPFRRRLVYQGEGIDRFLLPRKRQ